jgi:ATP-dependent exoDNAse (exonuclease V) alpha subunit
VEKGIVYSIIKNNMAPIITAAEQTKYLMAGKPGILLCSFTNMAVRQIAKHFAGDITCITIHKALEFEPIYYDITDANGDVTGRTMRFEPSRHAGNPLPASIKTIIVDESSMVDTELFQLLWDALPNPHSVQFIFLGDLNQLPPVYGSPILGRKLLELPVIELTHVYRQALLSPIISLAHDMKNGITRAVKEKETLGTGEHGRVVIHPWSSRLGWEDALHKVCNHAKGAIEQGAFDPMQDMILCPYNVQFGVLEINSTIADYLGRKRKAVVHEVIAGFNKKYLAIGDKVLVQKQEAFIKKITKNPRYAGKSFMSADKFIIDRWGGASLRPTAAEGETVSVADFDNVDFDVDAFLENMQFDGEGEKESRKQQSSHQVEVVFMNDHVRGIPVETIISDEFMKENSLGTFTLTSAAELNEMLGGYAITVHKSQGSEWRNVFLYLHHSHSRMCSRELLYTAMTRAKDYLYIICEADKVQYQGTLTKAALNPRLKGNTLAEKLVALKKMFDEETKDEG